jgi:hypothetical protein
VATLPAAQNDGAAGVVERLLRIRVEAYDWNFPQFMTPRFTPAS